MWPAAKPFFVFWIMGKMGVRAALNVLLLTSFVGGQPVGEVEQEHGAEFPEDFEVLPLRDAVGFPLLWAYLPLGSLTSSAAPATQREVISFAGACWWQVTFTIFEFTLKTDPITNSAPHTHVLLEHPFCSCNKCFLGLRTAAAGAC